VDTYGVDRCEVEWNSEILGIKVPIEVRGTRREPDKPLNKVTMPHRCA
jgi:hypothetical protein